MQILLQLSIMDVVFPLCHSKSGGTIMKKQKYIKYMYLPAAILNVLLNFVFIPLWGASGAAFASLITQIATSVILPLCIKATRPNAKLMLEAIILKDVFNGKQKNNI